jgi:hypothetical protein
MTRGQRLLGAVAAMAWLGGTTPPLPELYASAPAPRERAGQPARVRRRRLVPARAIPSVGD